MKTLMFFGFLMLSVGVVAARGRVPRMNLVHDSLSELGQQISSPESATWSHFVKFVRKFGKQYENVDEARRRFSIFRQNLEELGVKNAQAEGSTAVHGITQFFDFTRDEFRQMSPILDKFLGLRLLHPKRNGKHDLTESELRRYRAVEEFKSLDWRELGYVTPVKNQGQCGSCFIFGALGAVEGQWFKKTGKLISLSEEEALDCGDDQCGGGDPLHVYDTIAEQGGLESENDYPYSAGKGDPSNCTLNESKFVAYTNGSRAIPIHDEELLGQVLTVEGPVEVNINADPLFDYVNGVLDPEQEDGHHAEQVNHAVLLVGYGEEAGVRFWIIKNSWGNFGEEGYFRVKRGTNRMFLTDSNPSLPLIL